MGKFTSLKCMNMLLSNINISELSHYLVNHYYDHHVGITSAAEKGLKQMATMLSAMSSIFLQHKLSHFLASKKEPLSKCHELIDKIMVRCSWPFKIILKC